MQIPFWASTEALYWSYCTLHTETDLIFVLCIGCKTLVPLQCFNNFWMGLILRDGRERWKRKEENIITVCTYLYQDLSSPPPLSQPLFFLSFVESKPKPSLGPAGVLGSTQKKPRRRIKRDMSSAIKSLMRPKLCMWDSQMPGESRRWTRAGEPSVIITSVPCDEQETALGQAFRKGLKGFSETDAWSIVTTVVPSGDPKEKYKSIKSQQGMSSLRQA